MNAIDTVIQGAVFGLIFMLGRWSKDGTTYIFKMNESRDEE